MSTKKDLSHDIRSHGILSTVRKRLSDGDFRSADDFVALRRFVRMTQLEFAQALGISVSTLRSWEQGARWPEGPALALLSIAAGYPHIIHERLKKSAAA